MDIQTQVMQYKYHLAIAVSVSAIVSWALYAAPPMGTIVAYFWPLIASTAIFVAAIVAFSGVAQLAVDEPRHGGEKHGEDIVDYVAGRHEYTTVDEDHHRT